jgi:Ca-activated chloride channel family protein
MSFVHPYLMLLMGIPFLIMAVIILTNKDKLSRIFHATLLERLSAHNDALHPKVRSLVLFIAIFCMLIALGRPIKELGEKRVDMEGLTLLVGLDISASMRSEDQYPNRLTFAKKKIESLLEALPSDEVGMVAFAQKAFMISPFTTNKETLIEMVAGIDSSYISHGATNFEAIATLSSNLLEKKSTKVLILFSDGGDKEALEGLQQTLSQHNIHLYTVLVGTTKGAPVLNEQGKPFSLKDGTIAITQRNDTLLTLSTQLGGEGFIASTGKEDMQQLATTLKSRYSNQSYGEVTIKEQKEYFYYPLAIGIGLLLLGLSSLPRRVERVSSEK